MFLAAVAAIVVPLYPMGPMLTVDVTIGKQKVRMMVDTGSSGLRIISKAIDPENARRTGTAPPFGYGSGTELKGDTADAQLAIGSAQSSRTVGIELVDGFGCTIEAPDCAAGRGVTPLMFGGYVPGILGVGPVTPPGGCCDNPLRQLVGGEAARYIVHAKRSRPTLTLAPDSATTDAFTQITLSRNRLGFDWPDGCISAPGIEYCGMMFFDTGSSGVMIMQQTVASPTSLPPGTKITLSVGQWSHDLIAGSYQLPVHVVPSDRNRIIVGLPGLQDFDVYFDLVDGHLGFKSNTP